jgi:hypothetical protein
MVPGILPDLAAERREGLPHAAEALQCRLSGFGAPGEATQQATCVLLSPGNFFHARLRFETRTMLVGVNLGELRTQEQNLRRIINPQQYDDQ